MRTLLILLMIPLNLYAPTHPRAEPLDYNSFIIAYQRSRILSAIILTESEGDSTAINEEEDAVGILQIRPVMLKHIDSVYQNFELKDRLSVKKSIEMFDLLMRDKNPRYNLDTACLLWNCGTLYPSARASSMVRIYKRKVITRLNNLKNEDNAKRLSGIQAKPGLWMDIN